MTRRVLLLFVLLCGLMRGIPAARGAEQVDLLLVLAADVSRSMDDAKFELQRRGYAMAISDPAMLRAIAAGPNGRIAVAFMEWSGLNSQKLVIGWTVVANAEDAKAFSGRLLELPRSYADRTALGSAIDYARALFASAPAEAERKVIDISGDGTSNGGRDIHEARDEAIAAGITAINGLVILSDTPIPYNPEHTNPPGGLENYYRENVIGGENAFVMVAENFESFGRSLVAKLIREIS